MERETDEAWRRPMSAKKGGDSELRAKCDFDIWQKEVDTETEQVVLYHIFQL